MSATGTTRCNHCGAEVPLPADPSAVAATCAYCHRATQLPSDVVRQRRADHAALAQAHAAAQHREAARQGQRVASRITVIIAISVPLTIVAVGAFVIVKVFSAVD